LYQKGPQFGFENIRAYVLYRDGHTCQCCKGKSKKKRLEVHHKIFRTDQGTDAPANLVTVKKLMNEYADKIALKYVN
jgi:5-methylcytosine-specific restriction endonuclease McrA